MLTSFPILMTAKSDNLSFSMTDRKPGFNNFKTENYLSPSTVETGMVKYNFIHA